MYPCRLKQSIEMDIASHAWIEDSRRAQLIPILSSGIVSTSLPVV